MFPSLSSRGNREVGMGASAETGDGTISAEGKGPELEYVGRGRAGRECQGGRTDMKVRD